MIDAYFSCQQVMLGGKRNNIKGVQQSLFFNLFCVKTERTAPFCQAHFLKDWDWQFRMKYLFQRKTEVLHSQHYLMAQVINHNIMDTEAEYSAEFKYIWVKFPHRYVFIKTNVV